MLYVLLLVSLACNSCFALDAKSGFELRALGCDIDFPAGYSLNLGQEGMLKGSYMYRDSEANPSFIFSPNKTWESVTTSSRWEVQSTEIVSGLTFQKVEGHFYDESTSMSYNVVSNDTGFFASYAKFGMQFVQQFKQCAEE